MKTLQLIPEYVEQMPEQLSDGIHLCACGCKGKTVTGLQPHWKDGWVLIEKEGKITLRPSIGNFAGENRYHAHYYITENKIEWLE
jgi:hypothetical protein